MGEMNSNFKLSIFDAYPLLAYTTEIRMSAFRESVMKKIEAAGGIMGNYLEAQRQSQER